MDIHEPYMQQCIALAQQALQRGDPPVGAIVVHREQTIGQGVESGKSTNDVTNHAEIIAIRDTIANGQQHQLSQAILYTTHEPCIMCSYVIRHHQIPRIVYGVPVDFIGGVTSCLNVLGTNHVPQWRKPTVIAGVSEQACRRLSEEFSRKDRQRL